MTEALLLSLGKWVSMNWTRELELELELQTQLVSATELEASLVQTGNPTHLDTEVVCVLEGQEKLDVIVLPKCPLFG